MAAARPQRAPFGRASVRRRVLLGSVVPDHLSSPVVALRTHYPSSTAMGHAALLTGTAPAPHHIVGNRFWEHEDAKTIRARANDPVTTFYPYGRRALACDSLLDAQQRAGLCIVAVQFLQTPDWVPSPDPVAAVFWLYVPAREVTVRFGVDPPRLMTRYLRQEVPSTIARTSAGLSVSQGGGAAQPLAAGGRATLRTEVGQASLSVPVEVRDLDPTGCRPLLRVAAVTLASGEVVRTTSLVLLAGISESYRDGCGAECFCVPGAAAVTDTTLALVEAVGPASCSSGIARWTTRRSFSARTACASPARCTVSAGPSSGRVHGRPRAGCVLWCASSARGSRWSSRPTTGSTGWTGPCCSASSAAPTKRSSRVVARDIAALGPGVRTLSERDLCHLDLPMGSPWLGMMALGCGPHQEFLYDEGPLHERVRSAAHGFTPDSPAMDDFARFAGRASSGIPAPARRDGLRAVLEVIRRTFDVDA